MRQKAQFRTKSRSNPSQVCSRRPPAMRARRPLAASASQSRSPYSSQPRDPSVPCLSTASRRRKWRSMSSTRTTTSSARTPLPALKIRQFARLATNLGQKATTKTLSSSQSLSYQRFLPLTPSFRHRRASSRSLATRNAQIRDWWQRTWMDWGHMSTNRELSSDLAICRSRGWSGRL